jgi:DNA polymerase-3 subunit beta
MPFIQGIWQKTKERQFKMIRFTCFKNELHDAISKVSGCTVVKTTMPFLESIRFRLKGNKLELNGFNLEYGIKSEITVETDDENQEGEFLILPRLISEATRRMDSSTIDFHITDKYLVEMKGGDTEYTISASFAGEYPELPVVAEDDPILIQENIFKSMIRQTKYATSNNEMKPVMMGQLFDVEGGVMHLVAIDGFRLAICRQEVDALVDTKFIIHKKAMSLIDTFLKEENEDKIAIFSNGKHALFKLNGCTFCVRLMEGVFHNYKASIPNTFETEVIINAKKLQHSLERCALLINDKNKSPIKCTFSGNSVNIKCETGVGKINDFVPIEISGPDVRIGFNNQYLLEASRFADCEKVKIQMTGDKSVVQMIALEGDSFRFLLMPIRIKED